MTENNLSVDELLDQQDSSATNIQATVEKIDEANVKITPWKRELGCLCSFSITVPKSAIDFLTPTGEYHLCCGKQLMVVEVKFTDEARPYGDVLTSLMSNQPTSPPANAPTVSPYTYQPGIMAGAGFPAHLPPGLSPAMMASMDAAAGGCGVVRGVWCSAVVSAAVVACVETGGVACGAAIAAVVASGCCPCLPAWLRPICN